MTTHIHNRRRPGRSRQRMAFTLVEMTIVVMVIAILAALALPVFITAQNQAKAHRTRAMIAKIDQIIGEKWDAYRTRQVPIRVNPRTRAIGEPFTDTLADADLTNGIWNSGESFIDQNANNQYDIGAAELRMIAMRELQRCELPNLMADVLVNPVTISRPAVSKAYFRRASASWSVQFEGAECLYLILAAARDNDKNALDFFSPSEIGDTDADGMNEVLDGWGMPIEFVRWPFGYAETPGADGQWGLGGDTTQAGTGDDLFPVATPQTRNSANAPDPFDPFGADGRKRNNNPFTVPVALKPLIYSPGPNKLYDVQKLALTNPLAAQISDPFRVEFASGRLSAGSPIGAGFQDNITNHDLEAR